MYCTFVYKDGGKRVVVPTFDIRNIPTHVHAANLAIDIERTPLAFDNVLYGNSEEVLKECMDAYMRGK